MTYVIAYGATAIAFLVIDLIWLGVVAKTFYRDQLGALMVDQINVPAAVAFYLLYVFGIVFFAVVPALNADSWRTAIVAGVLLGLVAYGTYDLTNLATLRGWPIGMALVDLAWGAIVTAASAAIGFWVTRSFS